MGGLVGTLLAQTGWRFLDWVWQYSLMSHKQSILVQFYPSSLSDFRRKSFVFNNGTFEGKKLCPLKSNT